MEPISQQFAVTYRYEVAFTRGLFKPSNPLLADTVRAGAEEGPRRVLLVVDAGVLGHRPGLIREIEAYAAAHAEVMKLAGDAIVVPGGEASKNDPSHTERIQRAIAERAICRHSFVAIVGGGAVLDMAGYAASTAHRGIRHLRIPTTVLAQDDSAIGVKNGINAFASKNFLGTFNPPWAVLNDLDFLDSLDDRDWRSGIAEAVKVALIKDPDFFAFIEREAGSLAPPRRDRDAMAHLVHRCAQLHATHIATSGDPFEKGSSRPLDFGHWPAHRLEALTDFEVRHGEAVAIGIALDCLYANQAGMLDDASMERVLAVFVRLGFTLFHPVMAEHLDDPNHPRSLFRGLSEFREHLGGQLTILLLEGIGKTRDVHEVDLDQYREAIGLLEERFSVRTLPV
ncbi:MAG: 3-dehydroquinate synthase [Rhodothermales bacterium]